MMVLIPDVDDDARVLLLVSWMWNSYISNYPRLTPRGVGTSEETSP